MILSQSTNNLHPIACMHDDKKSKRKYSPFAEHYCVISDARQRSDIMYGVYTGLDIADYYKKLFVICHSTEPKWSVFKSGWQSCEHDSTIELSSESSVGFWYWKNLQSYNWITLCKANFGRYVRKIQLELPTTNVQTSLPAPKSSLEAEIEDSSSEEYEQTIMAAALEQLKNLSDQVNAIRERVKTGLDRIEQMENANGYNR
ncbi:MAG: hypothetical protein ACFFCW_41920 [Candidatus Hodarchaeota archaeon]